MQRTKRTHRDCNRSVLPDAVAAVVAAVAVAAVAVAAVAAAPAAAVLEDRADVSDDKKKDVPFEFP